jgi:phage host-nuclease inhibitor protein Gam
MNELLEYELQEIEGQEQADDKRITNLEEATETMRKLRWIKEKRNEYQGIAENELKRITEWLNKETKQLQGIEAYYEFLLTDYYQQEKAKNPKFKLTTPSGKVSSRTTKKYTWDDEKVMEYLETNDLIELVRVKKEIDKAEIKRRFDGNVNPVTGEVVDGITIEEHTSISVKVE